MKDKNTQISLFISYSWSNTDVADQIEKDLSQLQIKLQRDVRDLKYKASIPDFMAQIRDTDFAIVLLSEEYLKSKNCMIEVLHLLKEREYERKILPIVCGKPGLYSAEGRLSYTKHWENEKISLETIISSHKPEMVIDELAELKTINTIHAEVNQFLTYISKINNITFEELKSEGYKSLLEAIGFEDVSHMVSLLMITFISDSAKKEILLDEWFEKNNPTSDAYSIRAGIAKKQGNFAKAEVNYNKSIELNDTNAFAMNNYAFMLMCLNRDHDKAKDLLANAISILPDLPEPRLNLGCLLTDKFDDPAGAEEQYLKVISYNPTEPRAYNNLANIYKRKHRDGEDHSDLICELYEKAISLNNQYIEARLGYSNFLSDFLDDYNSARAQLNEIVKIDAKAKQLTDSMNSHIEDLIKRKIANTKIGRNELCPCGSGLKFKNCHRN
jgi:Tfp pilus assembly protein PilF